MKKINKVFFAVAIAACLGALSLFVGAETISHFSEKNPTQEELAKEMNELNARVSSYAEEQGLDLNAPSYAYDIPTDDEPELQEAPAEITVTHLPTIYDDMTDEEKEAYFLEHPIESSENVGVFTGSLYARNANPPTVYHNLAYEDYTGSGTFTNSYMYTLRYFSCGANKTLTLNGVCDVPFDARGKTLTITLIEKSGNGYTEIPIVDTAYQPITNSTRFYYNFEIGPLGANTFYYFRWTPLNAISQHTISFTVSN